jgi:hypothetical protein
MGLRQGAVSLDGSFASSDPIDLEPFRDKKITRDDFIADTNTGYKRIMQID